MQRLKTVGDQDVKPNLLNDVIISYRKRQVLKTQLVLVVKAFISLVSHVVGAFDVLL